MRTAANSGQNTQSDSIAHSLHRARSDSGSSSLVDASAQFRQEAASQSLAQSVQQRAQENPEAFRQALQQAYGDKASSAQLDALTAMAAQGNVPLPQNVQFVNAGELGPQAMGAYDSVNGGTIYLDSRLLNEPQKLEAVYTEELGHHLDAILGGDAPPTPVEEEGDETPGPKLTFDLPGTRDLLERETVSGGDRQIARNDYVFSPSEGRFVREHESNQFAPNQNTIELFGGTSDNFRYNNSDVQVPENNRNIEIGDSVSTSGFLGFEDEVSVGDDDLGASADISAGAEGTATAGYSVDRNGVDLNAGVEGFVGVEANAEAHVGAGPLSAEASVEAQAGAMGSADAGLSLDMTNGLSGELGFEAFAGAQVNLGVGGGLGDSVEVGAGVDLKAGIGIEASGEVEFGWDNVGVDIELGAAFGIGADFNIDVSISPVGIVDDAGDVVNGIGDYFGW